MSYADLLRDPRWQRKRLEVMQAADFQCELCHATDKTLNVHHTRYVQGRKPWEYDRSELECLCEPCHKDEHGIGEKARQEKARIAGEAAVVARRERVRERFPWEYGILMQLEEIKSSMTGKTSDEMDATMMQMMALHDELREKGDRRASIMFKRWVG